MRVDHGGPSCISFKGADTDEAIGREILELVKPAALQVTLRVGEEQIVAQDNLLETLRTELQAARYSADRAAKQFDAVDPANRLVADELERRWNAALERVREIEQRVRAAEDARKARPVVDPVLLTGLAEDLDQVWNAPGTDARLKKRIARTVIEEVIVDVDVSTSSIVLVVHWKGGVHTELRVPKRSFGGSKTATPPDVVEAVRQLARVANDEYIAQALSRAGLRTAQGHNWSKKRVASVRHGHGIEAFSAARKEAEGWMTLEEAARQLNVADATLKRAAARGMLKAVQPLANGPWIVQKKDLEGLEPRIRLPAMAPSTREGDAVQSTSQLVLEIPRR